MKRNAALQAVLDLPTPKIRADDSDGTMLLRVFEAAGFDFDHMSWYAEPEGYSVEFADVVRAAAEEMHRQSDNSPPWSTVIEKYARELVVLLRAWESAPKKDREALSDMVLERQASLEDSYRYLNDEFM